MLSFEWTWSNCDGDPEDIIENSEDIIFDCDEFNTSVRLGLDDDAIIVTISVTFEVQLKDDVTKEEVESWLDENSAWSCGHVSPGWTYSGSDGENIWLTELRY